MAGQKINLRFSHKKMVTVSSIKIDFNELVGKVVRIGNASLDVEIFQEEMYEDSRRKSIHGKLTFVAVDDPRKPIAIL